MTLGVTGSIWIGQLLKGAVVAVGRGDPINPFANAADPLDGTMGDVTIGYAPVEGFDPPRNSGRGLNSLVGDFIPVPFEGSFRDNWYSAEPNDGGAVDAVVRAANFMGDVRIAAVSDVLAVGKQGKARVESPTIASIDIESFYSGAVWSGVLSTAASQNNRMSDDYAIVTGEVNIGCMGAKADLWVTSTEPIAIRNDMFGEIHLSSLESNQLIRIGGRLGDLDQAVLQGAPCGGVVTKYLVFEDSPRGYWEDVESINQLGANWGVARYSRIILEESNSLKGQIIIDASNTTGAHRLDSWKGDVFIGTGTPDDPETPTVISSDVTRASSSAAVAPLYSIASSVLGGTTSPIRGGAIGLVPFAVYGADSLPVDPFDGSGLVDAAAFSAGAAAVEAAFYGPILLETTQTGTNLGTDVCKVNGVSGACGSIIDDVFVSAAGGRVLSLSSANTASFTQGIYRMEFDSMTAGTRTLCQLFGSTTPVALNTKYQFGLSEPCTELDEMELCVCFAPFCFVGDYDGSGSADGDDTIAFFADWDAGNPAADVNFSGGVDGDDTADFFCWWDKNACN